MDFRGGGRRIKDATAKPEDVRAGAIFYNNGGRNIGTMNPLEVKSKLYKYPGAGFEVHEGPFGRVSRFKVCINEVKGTFEWEEINSANDIYYNIYDESFELKKIMGVKVGNMKTDFCIDINSLHSKGYFELCITKELYSEPLVYINKVSGEKGHYIYTEGYDVTLYYI